MTDIIKIQKEITEQLANKEVFTALVNTTFKGLEQGLVKRAIMEGMMRGFEFKDFLEKNVYAIPFGKSGYSLVTSIDYARKIGMRSGVVGKSAPIYQDDKDGKIVSCTITIKKASVGNTIGEYTATVFFNEYNTSKNQWSTKPRTMIAKVAEMHALRMACPEQLSQAYSEDEMEKEVKEIVPPLDVEALKKQLQESKDAEELKKVWVSIPAQAKVELKAFKDELKNKFNENPKIQ
jgi:hypothetical protein